MADPTAFPRPSPGGTRGSWDAGRDQGVDEGAGAGVSRRSRGERDRLAGLAPDPASRTTIWPTPPRPSRPGPLKLGGALQAATRPPLDVGITLAPRSARCSWAEDDRRSGRCATAVPARPATRRM